MKTIEKHCRSCQKATPHLLLKNMEIGERILLDIFTFGFNELFVSTYYECTHCGTKSN